MGGFELRRSEDEVDIEEEEEEEEEEKEETYLFVAEEGVELSF